MAVLIIGATERERIVEIKAHASAHPVLFDQVRQGVLDHKPLLELKDRKPNTVRPVSETMIFPGGYRASFSIEQQPAGMCSHLSISVFGRSKKGQMPSPEAVAMIAQEFGIPFPPDNGWMEEYERGEFAINLVSLKEPTKEGNA